MNMRESSKYKTELDIIMIAFVAVALAALSNFAIYGSLTDVFVWAKVKKWTLVLTLMFTGSVGLMYFFLLLLKSRSRESR